MMVAIAVALQNQLIDAARAQLGPDGEALLRGAVQHSLAVPVEDVTYAQLPQLLAALAGIPPTGAGQAPAALMADELVGLAAEVERGLHDTIQQALVAYLGPAADLVLSHVCTALDLTPDGLKPSDLPRLAAAIEERTTALLGAEVAQALATSTRQCAATMPPEWTKQLLDRVAAEAGTDLADLLRTLCRDHLEVELEDLDIEGIPVLARVVRREAPGRIGATRIATYLSVAERLISNQESPLGAQLLLLTNRQIGPAGPLFLKGVCARHGLPLAAICPEHLAWLAEALRAEAAPLLGERAAAEYAREISALRTLGG